jgi:hypothetical protein
MTRPSWLSVAGLLVWIAAVLGVADPSNGRAAQASQSSQAQGSIPAIYRGRWAPSLAACQVNGLRTRAVEITARGWTSFEEGSRVSAPGNMVRGTLYFRIFSFVSDSESQRGTLALRLAGHRLAMSETVAGRSIHRDLVRCGKA